MPLFREGLEVGWREQAGNNAQDVAPDWIVTDMWLLMGIFLRCNTSVGGAGCGN